jgi:hypothetical protein
MYKIPESMKGKVGSYDLSKFNKPSNPNKNQETIDKYLQGGKQQQVQPNRKKGSESKPVSNISSRLSQLLATKVKNKSVPAAENNNSTYSIKPNLSIFKNKPEPEDVDNYDEENMEDVECGYLDTDSSLVDIISTINYLLDIVKGGVDEQI